MALNEFKVRAQKMGNRRHGSAVRIWERQIWIFATQPFELALNVPNVAISLRRKLKIISLKHGNAVQLTTSMICMSVMPKLTWIGSDSLATGRSSVLYLSSRWCSSRFSCGPCTEPVSKVNTTFHFPFIWPLIQIEFHQDIENLISWCFKRVIDSQKISNWWQSC